MDVDPERLLKRLPKLKDIVNGDIAEDEGPLPSPESVMARYGDRIPRSIRQWLRARTATGNRSKALWAKYFDLFGCGLDAREVLAVIEPTVWNKFRGVPGGLRRDVYKAWAIHQHEATVNGRSANGRAAHREKQTTRFKREPVHKILARDIVPTEWLIEDLWTDCSHGFIAGAPKVRKSWLAIDIAVSVATGTPVFGHFKVPKAMPVLYVQEELSDAELRKRVGWIAASKEPSWEIEKAPGRVTIQFPRSIHMDVISRQQLDLSSLPDREALEEEIVSGGIKLVILDPLQMMLGDRDENSSREMRSILLALQAMKERTGTSIMIVHHYAKPSATNPRTGGQRMLGSQVFHAWLECGLYLTKDKARITEVERDFRNDIEFPHFEIEYLGGREGYRVAVSIHEGEQPPVELTEFEDYVRVHNGQTIYELASTKLFGSPSTIRRLVDNSPYLRLEDAQGDNEGGRPPKIVIFAYTTMVKT